MSLIVVLLAMPFGVGAAIYLEEYASDNWLARFIRTNIHHGHITRNGLQLHRHTAHERRGQHVQVVELFQQSGHGVSFVVQVEQAAGRRSVCLHGPENRRADISCQQHHL